MNMRAPPTYPPHGRQYFFFSVAAGDFLAASETADEQPEFAIHGTGLEVYGCVLDAIDA